MFFGRLPQWMHGEKRTQLPAAKEKRANSRWIPKAIDVERLNQAEVPE
jgi:hypothetical protein